jgi:hypothetical protein
MYIQKLLEDSLSQAMGVDLSSLRTRAEGGKSARRWGAAAIAGPGRRRSPLISIFGDPAERLAGPWRLTVGAGPWRFWNWGGGAGPWRFCSTSLEES